MLGLKLSCPTPNILKNWKKFQKHNETLNCLEAVMNKIMPASKTDFFRKGNPLYVKRYIAFHFK